MTDKQPQNGGVRTDFMRSAELDGMASTEKIRYIIDRIRKDHIVVLESGLTPDEESRLIEMTMAEIDQDMGFTGIEIESYCQKQEEKSSGFLGRVIDKTKRDKEESNLTVVGPASQVETLHKDDKRISTILNPNN